MNLLSALGLGAKPPAAAAVEPIVQVESLGREHSGKTGCKSMVYKITQQGPLPSGLELSADNPRGLVRLMNDSIATFRGLQTAGFTSTIEPEQVSYSLYRADAALAVLKMRESVGQLLTYTDEDSGKRMQEQFGRHHENLAAADVIHVFVSCPTDDRPESVERLQNDLTLLMPNLRAVLACRPPTRKVAVAVVVSKPDPAFATADDAKAALTDERLRGMLHRLVLLLEGSDRVGLAAVFVVSAFGYGRARRLDSGRAGADGVPPKGFSLLSQGEAEWVLREGELPAPHNLTALVWWTLMAGLALKPADRQAAELARTAQLLRDDLKAMGAWFVPLNCRPLS